MLMRLQLPVTGSFLLYEAYGRLDAESGWIEV